MKRLLVASSIVAGASLVALDADAAGARRVVVGGRGEDPIGARVDKELTAMGFEVVRIDAEEGCSRAVVGERIRDAGAHAAACTDGDAVGIWIVEPGGLRLRDVVVAQTPDTEARDMAAVRAAEIARASIELVDAEAEAKARAVAPPPAPAPSPATAERRDADRPAAAPAKANARRTPAFVASGGLSTLMGVDASVAAFSAEAEIGITRWLAVAPRLELPLEDRDLAGTPQVKARPGFTGVAAVVPVAPASAFIIPRFGAGVGAAWIRADATPATTTRFDPNGAFQTVPTTTGGTDKTWSLAAYGTAALSMRIVGPVRMNVDGVFGTTLSRLVVRTQGVDRAYWGAPFGALALRLEVMIR